MKKTSVIFSIIFSILLSLSSCASDSIVPGRQSRVIQNLYNEYMNLGDAYYELKKYDKAAVYYQSAMESKELYWAACNKLAETYVKQSKWTDSEALYQKLLKRDPENVQLKEVLAYIYASSGKFNESVSIYEQLRKDFPESQTIFENYIVVLISSEKYEEARTETENLLAQFPDNAKVTVFNNKINELSKKTEDNKEGVTTPVSEEQDKKSSGKKNQPDEFEDFEGLVDIDKVN